MQITHNKLNNASVRRKFDPLYKNILLRQNPFELVFKDISTFDGQNPIISKLLLEILIGKNNSVDKILKKVHSNHKVKIRSKLDGIRRFSNKLPSRKPPGNDDDDDDNDDNYSNFQNFNINFDNNNNNINYYLQNIPDVPNLNQLMQLWKIH